MTDGHAVGRSALQRVYDILRVKYEMEQASGGKATSAKVADQFAGNLKLSKHSEPVATSTVDCALTLGARVLGNPRAMVSISWCEESYGLKSPWNSIYKLQEVVSRAQSPEAIDWVFESLTDSVRMGFLDPGELSARNIGERGTKYLGGCALLKRSLLEHFLTDFFNGPLKLGDHLPSDVRNRMQAVLRDHCSVRASLTGYPGSSANDLTWQCGWPDSAIATLDLFEAIPLFKLRPEVSRICNLLKCRKINRLELAPGSSCDSTAVNNSNCCSL